MVWAEMCGSVKQCNYTECEIQELLIHGTIVFNFNTLHGCLIYTQHVHMKGVCMRCICICIMNIVSHIQGIQLSKKKKNRCANIFPALPDLAGHVFL